MKRAIIIALLALIAVAGQAQTEKTATIKGYSPALKDSTEAICFIDMTTLVPLAKDTVKDGRFTLTVPVEMLTTCLFVLEGEGCPNYLMTLYLAPDATVSMTGNDCFYPLWIVESPLPEQATANSIVGHQHDALKQHLQLDLADAPYEKQDSLYQMMLKQTLDILPSLPTDLAALNALEDVAHYARATKGFPYIEQLKEVEQGVADRAPIDFEEKLSYIHSLVYPPHILQPGDEAIDADFIDMQGNKHHLAELKGRYVLLDFWSLGCGPCRMAEPEMRKVYETLNGKMEIVGINRDKTSYWQENDWSKKIVWQNWNDGKMGKGGIENHYCDNAAIPYYVLLSPEHRVVWKHVGYTPALFLGLAEAIKGPRQDNGNNLQFAVRKVEASASGTNVSFRYYGSKDAWFRIAGGSFLEANGKRYKIIGTEGIALDAKTFPQEKATDEKYGILTSLCYADFTLTFEPFDTLPVTFDFKEGDFNGAFVISGIR